jgi:hypothetical protein
LIDSVRSEWKNLTEFTTGEPDIVKITEVRASK